jgi:hypothetical protein
VARSCGDRIESATPPQRPAEIGRRPIRTQNSGSASSRRHTSLAAHHQKVAAIIVEKVSRREDGEEWSEG